MENPLIATLFSIPLGTMISKAVSEKRFRGRSILPATLRCGSTNFSKFGFTNANHCLIHPSISLPRSATSRKTDPELAVCEQVGSELAYFFETDKYLHLLRKISGPNDGKPKWRVSSERLSCLHIQQLEHSWIIQRKDALQYQDMW